MKILYAYSVVKMSLLALLPAIALKAPTLQKIDENDPLLPFPGIWDEHH